MELTGVQVLDGPIELEVVGESHYQENLHRIVPRSPSSIRIEICGVLLAERDNHYDPNAISVWINNLEVGYLSREDAAAFRPGLLALERRYAKPIGLRGIVAGLDMLGVFLRHTPRDFGLPDQERAAHAHGRIRTGESDALATDAEDDSYDMGWLPTLPTELIPRVAALTQLLITERDLLDRHFIYHELERALYRLRNATADALTQFDQACRQHDLEMNEMRGAFLRKWAGVPWLETYRQMCIREVKAGNLEQAIWWAERGLAIYGEEAARIDAVEDLRQRVAQCREEHRAPTRQHKPSGHEGAATETLKCSSCGRDFERVRLAGRKPLHCPTCRMSG